MTQIRCDSCGKEIRDARKDFNFNVILGRDLCVSCFGKLQDSVQHGMEKHPRYSFSEYKNLLAKMVVRMTGS